MRERKSKDTDRDDVPQCTMSGLQIWSLSYTAILLPVPLVVLEVVSTDQVDAVEGGGGERVVAGVEDEGKRGVDDTTCINVSYAMDVVEVNMTDAGT